MKRALVLTALLAIAAAVGGLANRAAARDRSYRLLISSGEASLNQNETLAAIEAFSGAVTIRPDAMLPRLRRGETYFRRQDLDLAARDFRAAASLDPTATRPLDALGDVLFAQERFKRAAETFEARLRLDDRSAETRYKLALARYRDGTLDVALEEARRAVVLDDTLADGHYLIALCLRDKGQQDGAAAALQRAIELAPSLVPAREELADLLGTRRRYSAQLEQLQALANLEPGRPERVIAVGLAQSRAGRFESAVATLTSALEGAADPSPMNAALGRVWLEIADQQPDRTDALGKALEALERAASAVTATSEVKALYGRALLRSGQLDAAEQLFLQATERYPVDPDALQLLGDVATRLKHPARARAALIAHESLDQSDTGAAARAARIGALSLQLDDAAGALPWLLRSLTLQPNDVESLRLLAEAQLRTGAIREARASVTRAMSLDPDSRPLRDLDRRLSRLGA